MGMADNSFVRIHIDGFTMFSDATIDLGSALNVIVGENGSGKSHFLKLAYSIAASLNQKSSLLGGTPTKTDLNLIFAQKLIGTFRPEQLGRLTSRKPGRSRAEIDAEFVNGNARFSFASNSRKEVVVEQLPSEWLTDTPVFLPTREIMSIYPGFVSLYNERSLEFEETYRDTADLLGRPVFKGPRRADIQRLLHPLEQAMEGSVREENGRFYLVRKDIGKLEIHLVAEGLRKIAMLARLIANGSLMTSGYLFWDEPESNLNPRMLKQVAKTIVSLGAHGVQVFIATHSLFLLRQIEIELASPKNSIVSEQTRFIGLNSVDGRAKISSGETIDHISVITALDEEIQQADEYMEQIR